jgi:hypothetical protein
MLQKISILNIILLFVFICIIYIICINYNSYDSYDSYNQYDTEPFSNDYYTCTMNLFDINNRFVDEYMKFDGKHIPCGPCQNAKLKMNISPCATNANGSPSPKCDQNANIVSSDGRPIVYPSFVTLDKIKKFFCFE